MVGLVSRMGLLLMRAYCEVVIKLAANLDYAFLTLDIADYDVCPAIHWYSFQVQVW
jgi:hypothetical protein